MPALPVKSDSAFNPEQMAAFLTGAKIPMRLACNGSNGFPLVASHWYQFEDGLLYLAVHCNSHVAALLQRNPRCGFEIAADTVPYRGVRGQGTVTLGREGAGARLEGLILHYLGNTDSKLARWLLSRASEEYVVCIAPIWITSWDYSPRMVSQDNTDSG